MKNKLLIFTLILGACAPSRDVVQIYRGTPGASGVDGVDGRDGQSIIGPSGPQGLPGASAVNAGLSCAVHDMADSQADNQQVLDLIKNSPTVGVFVLSQLNVGDSQATNGFPGMPADLQTQVGTDGYALDCDGYLNVPDTGNYTLKMLSDDGVVLKINNEILIDRQTQHAPSTDTTVKLLNRGLNKINVMYYQGRLTQIALELRWSGPQTAEQVVPAEALSH